MKKHLKRLLSLMMAVLLCIGVMPSSAFAASYDYDGYISMIDHNTRGYSLSSNLPAPFGGYSSNKFTELRINDLKAFRTAYCIQFSVGVHTGIGYDQSDDYAAFTTEQKSMINTALTFGLQRGNRNKIRRQRHRRVHCHPNPHLAHCPWAIGDRVRNADRQ